LLDVIRDSNEESILLLLVSAGWSTVIEAFEEF